MLTVSDHNQHLQRDCTIYPPSTLSVGRPSVTLTEEDISRAKANLDNALGTLEQQLQLKRKALERLQASLSSKADIIQSCQDLLNGPLRSILYAGRHLGTPNPFSHEHALFQRRREQRRRKVLERLTPIIGNAVSTSFQSSIDDGKITMEPAERIEEMATLECASGWISTTLGVTIWFGVRVGNYSTQTMYNVRLSVARQRSRGIVLSRMDPQTDGVIIGLVQLDPLQLQDNEYLDRSLAVTRVLSRTVRLHFDKRQIPGDDVTVNKVTLSIPRFPVVEHCALSWQSSLGKAEFRQHAFR